MSQPPPQKKRQVAVLSSKVYNEAELVFRMLEEKERRCVSALDTVTLLRAMGMNPVQTEIDELQERMDPLIKELDELRLEEERKKEAIRKKEEAKLLKGKDGQKDKDKKDKDKKDGDGKGGEGGEGEGEGEDGKPKKRVLSDPPEEIKNIDWHIFITNAEPMYKDAVTEREEIIDALRVFDTNNTGKMTIDQLAEVCKRNGESVLSRQDVALLKELLPLQGAIDFGELADRLNGTWQPPPPPTAEELARMEEERKAAEEEERKRNRDNAIDDLIGSSNPAPTAAAADGAPAS